MADEYYRSYIPQDPKDEPGAEDARVARPAQPAPEAPVQSAAAPMPTPTSIPTPAPAAPQPAQANEWRNAYSSTPAAPYGGMNTNPYVARPVQSAPHPSAPTVNMNRPVGTAGYTRAGNPANTYVDAEGYYHRSFTEHRAAPAQGSGDNKPKRVKKEKARVSTGTIAILLAVCVLLAGAAGFGGGYLASKQSASGSTSAVSGDSSGAADYTSVSDQLVIHRVDVTDVSQTEGELVDKPTDEITRSVADSVVEITTEVVQTSSFYGQYIAKGAGSGVIISDDGYIVTNNHVIEGASNITVTLRSGTSYTADLIGADADEDVALIKIDATGLTAAVFGDSSVLEVGDKSVIIGNPLGTLGGSVTEGIVSALDRSIVIDGKTMHLMQTDAAINPGNSGGGMFNGQGELVGIVVAKSSGTTTTGGTIDNIGFVIPINNVLNILGDLKQYGYVRGKASTGMDFIDITNEMYAWYYFNSSGTGVFVSSVERGSNAAQAGFQAGDRVLSVDGKSVKSSGDIQEIISGHSVGDTISFEVERSGRTGTIDLVLEEAVPSTSR